MKKVYAITFDDHISQVAYKTVEQAQNFITERIRNKEDFKHYGWSSTYIENNIVHEYKIFELEVE